MKDIVVHVSDSVCAANNRDPEATALIEAAKSFGTVETLDQALSHERAKAQEEINKLNSQHAAEVESLRTKLASIEDRAVTDAELEILKLLRKKAEAESMHYQGEIKRRDEQLAAVVAEQEARKQQIRALYGL